MAQLTAADYTILSKYAANGQRELYWGYLAGKGDAYAARALEVVRNDSFSGQVANNHAKSYVPEDQRATFNEARWDKFGSDLMRADFLAREKLFDAHTADGGLSLDVRTIRDYHATTFIDYKLPQEAWTLERVIGPMIDGGDIAGAQVLWNQAMSNGTAYALGAVASSGQAVANGAIGWLPDTAMAALAFDPKNAFNNPNHINGFDYDASSGKWTRVSTPIGGAGVPAVVAASAGQVAALNADRQWRIDRLDNTARYQAAPGDAVNGNPASTSGNLSGNYDFTDTAGGGRGNVNPGAVTPAPATVFNPATVLSNYTGTNAISILPGDTVGSIAQRLDMNPAEFGRYLATVYGPNADLNSIVAGNKLPIPQEVYDRTLGGINGLDLPNDTVSDPFYDALVDAFQKPTVPVGPGVLYASASDGGNTGFQGGLDYSQHPPAYIDTHDPTDASSIDAVNGSDLQSDQYVAPSDAQLGATGANLLNTMLTLGKWDDLSDLQRAGVLAGAYNVAAGQSGGTLTGLPPSLAAGLGLLAALDSGDDGAILVSSLQLANTLGADLLADYIPGLNLLLAIDSGDPYSIVSSAMTMVGTMMAIPGLQILAVFVALAGTFQDQDAIEGTAAVTWDDAGQLTTTVTHSAEGGGANAQGALDRLLEGLNGHLASITDEAGNPAFALNPAKMPPGGLRAGCRRQYLEQPGRRQFDPHLDRRRRPTRHPLLRRARQSPHRRRPHREHRTRLRPTCASRARTRLAGRAGQEPVPAAHRCGPGPRSPIGRAASPG